jgi:integrase
MKEQNQRRIVFVRPMAELGSYGQACELAGIKDTACLVPRYFDLPLLAFVVDSEGVPIWAPTLYLAHCAIRSRSVTGDTVRSYAEALLVWLGFLDKSRADLRSVTEDTLATFRNQLVNRPNECSGRTYASATANHRITVVCAFHLWAQKHGVVESSLGAFLEARSIEMRGRSRRHMQRGVTLPRPLTPIVLRRLPRALSYDEVRLLFQMAPPPYRLIFKWALLTGLRRFEICKLTIGQLPSPKQLSFSRDGFVQINLRRKGSREVTVHVPVKLIEETRWYLLTERTRVDVEPPRI